jgi:hypothetical protein
LGTSINGITSVPNTTIVMKQGDKSIFLTKWQSNYLTATSVNGHKFILFITSFKFVNILFNKKIKTLGHQKNNLVQTQDTTFVGKPNAYNIDVGKYEQHFRCA